MFELCDGGLYGTFDSVAWLVSLSVTSSVQVTVCETTNYDEV